MNSRRTPELGGWCTPRPAVCWPGVPKLVFIDRPGGGATLDVGLVVCGQRPLSKRWARASCVAPGPVRCLWVAPK